MTRTVFFAHNSGASGTVDGTPVVERAAFLALLDGVGSEGFESQALNTVGPIAISFPGSTGSITATIQATSGGAANAVEIRAPTVGNTTVSGRFNTTAGGAQFLQARADFEILFDTPIAAFGFYGTDIGDFDATMQIVLTDSDGNDETIDFPVPGLQPDACLTFWGFIDDAKTYSKITMLIAQSGGSTDIFGFDDMVIGDPAQAGVVDPTPTIENDLRVTRGWGRTRHVVTVSMAATVIPPAA